MRNSLLSFPSLGIVKVIELIQPGSLGSLLIENLLEPYSSKALCKSRHLPTLSASFFLNEKISCFFLSVTVAQKKRERKKNITWHIKSKRDPEVCKQPVHVFILSGR